MVFHIVYRANARARIFGKEGDYAGFGRVMKETLAKRPMRILGYLIMPNHWHLVLCGFIHRRDAETRRSSWSRGGGLLGKVQVQAEGRENDVEAGASRQGKAGKDGQAIHGTRRAGPWAAIDDIPKGFRTRALQAIAENTIRAIAENVLRATAENMPLWTNC